MNAPEEIRQALEPLGGSGSVEVIENGRRVGTFEPFGYEVSGKGTQTLLHLWSEERNLVRRAIRITEQAATRVVIETQQFGRKKPGRIELVCSAHQRTSNQLSRDQFCVNIGRLLAEHFPDEHVESLTTAADLERSFSGCYSRCLLRRGHHAWAVIAAGPTENAETVDDILTYGLICLHSARRHSQEHILKGLRLLLPQGTSRRTLHRVHALSQNAQIELYEFYEATNRVCRIDTQDIGNLATSLIPRRELEYTLTEAGDWVERIRRVAPDAIGVGTPPGTRDVAFRFRGLEIARWHGGKVLFGFGRDRQELTMGRWRDFERFVAELQRYRHPYALDTIHPLYRNQPERWLEAIVLGDPLRIHPRLDPNRVYSQVPAFAAGDRGVIDLLGVTQEGRLVIMELKASEDIQMVMQAVDYWLRVLWHQEQDDFHRFGYFVGMELQQKAPLLLLVAPGLRFHPALDSVLSFLSGELEVMRIGLNENWRQGLQVVFRQ